MSELSLLVTVIVPSYEHAPYVEQTIAAVRAQTHPAVQLVVVDDGSTDGSQDVLRALVTGAGEKLILNQVNEGLNPSLEKGLDQAKGEYVAVLASDDLVHPEKIERQLGYLVRHGLDGVFANGEVLEAGGARRPIDNRRIRDAFASGRALRLLQTDDTSGPLLQSGLFRTDVLRSLAPVRRAFRSDDWALTITMLEKYRIGYLDEELFTYRQHASNSHRRYWQTWPMRVEVACSLTPADLRAEALANLLASQGSYLRGDGVAGALRYLWAAAVLDPKPGRLWSLLLEAARPTLRKVPGVSRHRQ